MQFNIIGINPIGLRQCNSNCSNSCTTRITRTSKRCVTYIFVLYVNWQSLYETQFRSSDKPKTMQPPFGLSEAPTPSPPCRQTSSLTCDTSTGWSGSTSTSRRNSNSNYFYIQDTIIHDHYFLLLSVAMIATLASFFCTFLRVTVEGGMKLSVMCRILETVSLGLDIFGRVPDLTVIDAIAVGTFGANAVLMHSINSVEVSSLT